MEVIQLVLDQHAEGAVFDWLRRSVAVAAPHYNLRSLARLDEKLEAHIDGLRIAGQAGNAAVDGGQGFEEPGEVFTAAVLALEARDVGRVRGLVDAVAGDRELLRGVVSALGWASQDDGRRHIDGLAASEKSSARFVGIAGAAVRRFDPGSLLERAANDQDPWLRARALKAVGELGRLDLLPACSANFSGADATCRFWGAWSGALLGDTGASHVLCEVAESDSVFAERAATMAATRMKPHEALAWQQRLAARSDRQRVALKVAGAIGDPAVIGWLLGRMEVNELARAAGEAFTLLTGVDLAYRDLAGEWPEGFEAGPTEDAEDESVDMDPDENLPWPNVQLVEEWWRKNKDRFKRGTQYLCGNILDDGWLRQVLRDGYQRQRAAAAVELTLRDPGKPLFNVKAPGVSQIRLLGGPGDPIQ